MSIQTVGIIGAGTMGNGIAQACAVSGVNVVMVDITEAAVAKGIATVSNSLDRLIKKEKMTEAEKTSALARINGSTQYQDLQKAFLQFNALQCGFCTSGMLLAATELIETNPQATRAQVREWISGNYCRCTGYQAIVDAICYVLEERLAHA
jgi:aerobic-type carbon monoxide dehydrogenase small subunit (CoxS/CutS family)